MSRLRSGLLRTAFLATLAVVEAASAIGPDFELESRDLKTGRFAPPQYYSGFGCGGKNRSPELKWSGAPIGTRSFAITIFDPDAPGAGFWHWGVANLPSTATGLPEGAGSDPAKMPAGAMQTSSDFGPAGYAGPCPPKGSDHHYEVTIYALRVERLDIDAKTTAAALRVAAEANQLAKARLVVRAAR